MRPLLHTLPLLALLFPPLRADSLRQAFSDFTTPLPVKPGDTLLLGIVGGWERWDHPTRCIRATALYFKSQHRPGLHVETVENHRMELAEQLVQRAFDFDGDGVLSPAEAAQARIVLYGHSLGGRATLRFARDLHRLGIRVSLAVIVDSFGRDSYVFPPNVAAAANFYQRDHIAIRGAPTIRAARILANRQFRYPGGLFSAHSQMEYDPAVWNEVRRLLAEALPAAILELAPPPRPH